MQISVGSIEVGKQADIVVHDRSRVEWIPASPDPVLQLIWGSDGRSVRDVYVAGNKVVADGRLTTVDIDALVDDAVTAGTALRQRSGIPTFHAGHSASSGLQLLRQNYSTGHFALSGKPDRAVIASPAI